MRMRPTRDERSRELSEHFEFGRNWQDYSRFIDEGRIQQAVLDMERLFGPGTLRGRSFLDIGSGSGLHSLAALRQGCTSVVAVDLDPQSVEATRRTLARHAPDLVWVAREDSVFAMSPETSGSFDLVYSWGVLHHTGDMWEAVRRAAMLVRGDGLLALALYIRTPCCRLWKIEKWLYARSPGWVQGGIRLLFLAAQALREAASGRIPFRRTETRGMRLWNDAHDWLGGYPYESASPEEVERFLGSLGFRLIRSFNTAPSLGFFGSACAEYLFQRSI